MISKINPLGRDWLAVKEQCEEWIEGEKGRLISAKTWEEALRMQGRIAAWMSVISMETNPGAQLDQ